MKNNVLLDFFLYFCSLIKNKCSFSTPIKNGTITRKIQKLS